MKLWYVQLDFLQGLVQGDCWFLLPIAGPCLLARPEGLHGLSSGEEVRPGPCKPRDRHRDRHRFAVRRNLVLPRLHMRHRQPHYPPCIISFKPSDACIAACL